MNKLEKFHITVRKHKKELLTKYKLATVNSWIYTDRIPKFDTAVELAPILGMKISEVPYVKIERNL